MVTQIQLFVILFSICFLIFGLRYFYIKKSKSFQELAWDSFTDALTLNSGIIILLYTYGLVSGNEYFSKIDNYSLIIALILAGIVTIGGSLDKLKKNGKEEK